MLMRYGRYGLHVLVCTDTMTHLYDTSVGRAKYHSIPCVDPVVAHQTFWL